MHFLSSINLRKCTKSGNILKEFCKIFSMKWGYGQAWPFELWSKWKSIWFGLCRPALDQLWGETPFALSEVSSALWQGPINQPERKNDDRSSEKSVEPHWLRHKRIVFFSYPCIQSNTMSLKGAVATEIENEYLLENQTQTSFCLIFSQ